MIRESLAKLFNKQDLTKLEAKETMDEIMSGSVYDILLSSYLTALRMKGETIDEIIGSAMSLREKCVKLNHDFETFEIVGTGGDKTNTFNISSISSFVIASTGIKVSKHGNRSVSSKCGTADFLEKIGVNINCSVEKNEEALKEIGICFMFAQKYHGAMKYAGPVRKELKERTIFNILGPLANPAFATYQLLGVYSKDLVKPLAKVLQGLGVKRGMVVYGDGMDEITASGITNVAEITDSGIIEYDIDPRDYGINICKKEDLEGGNPDDNVLIAKDIFNGVKGPKRDVVVLNAAAGIHICNPNITIKEAIKIAEDAIDSKKALEKLNLLIKKTGE